MMSSLLLTLDRKLEVKSKTSKKNIDTFLHGKLNMVHPVKLKIKVPFTKLSKGSIFRS